jgi:phosphate acyltransferase
VITIAVDAMGGDFAPHNVVEGALACARSGQCDFSILLVGKEDVISPLLPDHPPPEISVLHTDEVVEMTDDIATALKVKRQSSMYVALSKQRDGDVHGFISAGNTAAVMALSTLILGRLPGVERPCIGTFLPGSGGPVLLIDAGANVDSKPSHLMQFGVMGSIYTKLMLGLPEPRVGLLNVGEEKGKGSDACIATWPLLDGAPVNFIGNLEGRDIMKSVADVVVCDGFIGNILLKFAESIPSALKHKVLEYAGKSVFHTIWAGLLSRTLRNMLSDWDYQKYGGVPLLGVNGVSIIGHGSSSPTAISNMILRAKEMVDRRVNDTIKEVMASTHSNSENNQLP